MQVALSLLEPKWSNSDTKAQMTQSDTKVDGKPHNLPKILIHGEKDQNSYSQSLFLSPLKQ